MDTQSFKESLTNALRYWEPRRLIYNLFLAAVVLMYFGLKYPGSRMALSVDTILALFVLAVVANVAYCAAYAVDIFVQLSGYQALWLKYRWMLFVVGVLFASVFTRFIALGLFSSGPALQPGG